MENKNLYVMKQPELGKKILELRKQKGFTQEELVEKCNINVRTIQRIEAGDVTPRSFTIKTILEALGVDTKLFFNEPTPIEGKVFLSEDQKSILRTSWVSGIFLAVFSVIGMIIETYLLSGYNDFNDDFSDDFIPRVIWNTPFLIALFFFLKGYKTIGEVTKNNTLVTAAYAYFIMEVLISTVTIGLSVFSFEEDIVETLSGIVIAMLFGVSELILGIGVLKLKDHLGPFAQIIGILKIVIGIMLVTILLSPIAAVLVVPILILEIILIHIALDKLSIAHH
jgi:transcriptional regulator with XRE-family HTH domain